MQRAMALKNPVKEKLYLTPIEATVLRQWGNKIAAWGS